MLLVMKIWIVLVCITSKDTGVYIHSFTGVQQLIGVIERMILNIVMGCKCCTFQPEKQLHVLNVIVVVALHGELQLK